MTERKPLGMVLYAPPSKWRRRLARIIPWYHPQDGSIAYFDKATDGTTATVKLRWKADGTFTLDDEEETA
jgi:hypothetical protein